VWLRSKVSAELERLFNTCRRAARKKLKVTVREQRREAGKIKQEARDIKLVGKRAARDKKKAEAERIFGLARSTRYSLLKQMRNDELADQLKIYKLVLKRTGFSVTQKGREAYIIQVQALMTEEDGAAANDLPDGDPGVEGRGVRRRATPQAAGSAKKKGKRACEINE
jgi:vacuolar-type H+-ATPase subunit E/Vma4